MKKYKEKFDQLKSNRSTWDEMYQTVGEYVSQNKQNFQNSPTQGEFLTEEIFDSTATFAAQSSASAILGMLWPASAKQAIELTPPEDIGELSSEMRAFYERMNQRATAAMDDPKAGLITTLDEYMLDQVIFGTSGVGVFRGNDSKLMYRPYGVKELYVQEGANGKVVESYLLFEWEIDRIVDEYGIENVSENVREKYEAGKGLDREQVLIIIKRRTEPKAEEGVLSMPIASYHMLYKDCHKLKESGFTSFPIGVGRMRKLNYEKYGRSPAMNALPDIKELNALREAVIIGTEKALDMPKGVMNDGVFGGGVIDTSAGAITVFNSQSSGQGNAPIFDIGSPPDLSAALARIEDLKESISQHFHLDRLIDFNNDVQMTLGEAQIRDGIRAASLSSLLARQIEDVFTPMVERSISVLFEMGEFGVVRGSEEEAELLAQGREPEYLPDELLELIEQDKSIYEVRYRTKASQASRSEEYLALLDVSQYAANYIQVDPNVRHRMDFDAAIKKLAEIRGSSVEVIRSDEDVAALIQADQQAAQQQQGLEQLQAGADVAQKLGGLQDAQ